MSHGFNDVLDDPVLFIFGESIKFSILSVDEHTLFEDDFWGSFTKYSEPFFLGQFDDSTHVLSNRVESVDFIDFVFRDLIPLGLIVFSKTNDVSKESTFSLVSYLFRMSSNFRGIVWWHQSSCICRVNRNCIHENLRHGVRELLKPRSRFVMNSTHEGLNDSHSICR